MTETSRTLTFLGNRINQTYGGRHFRSVIGTAHYFYHAYKYVYRNPVAAGLCDRPENYPYSSLSGKLGKNRLKFPIVKDPILFEEMGVEKTLLWLNEKPLDQDWKFVGSALKKQKFKLPNNSRQTESKRLETQYL